MKHSLNMHVKTLLLLGLALTASLRSAELLAAPATAPVNLATSPLANSTTTAVKPNLMFIMDNSGSMADDFVPDWASSSTDYLKKNAGYNSLAYNAAITYEKPVYYNADGSLNTTLYPSQTGVSAATGASAATKPNWLAVKGDAYIGAATTGVEGNAYFYTIIPGEYCTASDLKTCVAATSAVAPNLYPATLRWCTTSAIAIGAGTPATGTCQAVNDTSHTFARYPSPRRTTITVNSASSAVVTGITAGGQQILSASTNSSNSTSTVAANIRDNINKCTTVITGSCTVAGYSALASGSVVTVVAPTNTAITAPVVTKSVTTTTFTYSTAAFSVISSNNAPGRNLLTVITSVNTSYAYPATTAVALSRTDCAGTTCTYAEEMTNYANWFTYYKTRMNTMKTSVSRAFKGIDSRYRVGYTTISDTGATDNTNFQHIDTFEFAQKNVWFTKLFAADGNSTTPLRGALSKVGRIFAHKLTGAADPMQYSCQQNFAILSTDGYWNLGSETGSYGPLNLTGGSVGNLDVGPVATTPRPMYEGPTAVSNSLADIAKYYYDNDLRTPTLNNCTGAIAGELLCATFAAPLTDDPYNNVFVSSSDNNTKQHMTTFTMGLGIDGVLNFTTDYQTATSGDYYRLKTGVAPTVNWPDPLVASTSNTVVARIDDLWHAAVNGRGVYFSAKKPDDIIAGFSAALASITSRIGAGAAAATSTLNPVAGDNFAYVASYTTGKWIGNLEARPININTGVVSEAASWCVEDVVAGSCPAPGIVTPDVSGGSTVYNCVTGASSVEVPKACAGKMPPTVSALSDTRKIWTKGAAASTLNNFKLTGGDLSAADFNSTKLSGLSQWAALTGTQQAAAAGDNIVNYLRGQTAYDDRSGNLVGAIDNRLFRLRDATLGDAVESQPAYIGKPSFSYTDAGYSDFKAAQAARPATVYMGANDGMLHAFNAATGDELWAFVPSMVIPNMWALADKNYSANHAYYANGSPTVSDIYDGGWKTILVSGLNGGGRGYYALDITNPLAPTLLWEFTPDDDSDLGYTFANPVITKKADGTWVVLVTSGYNNIPDTYPRVKYPLVSSGDGKGYLYVLNASSGATLGKISTGVGSTSAPSGLGQISTWADNPEQNNTASYTYGGDLLGNIWRFDINTNSVMQFAELKDSSGVAQPITTRPELGSIVSSDGKTNRIVFVGTGKYLETSDLTDTQQQTLYAIKDDNETIPFVNPRAYSGAGSNHMVQQTITTAGASRTASNVDVDFLNDRGWFVNFPDSGERENVASQLVLGTLLVPTTVPSNTVCSPGGTSWLNYFNYKTGGAVNPNTSTVVSTKLNAPIVGLNIVYITDATGKRKPVVSVVTADHPTPDVVQTSIATTPDFQSKRAIWRELIPEQAWK